MKKIIGMCVAGGAYADAIHRLKAIESIESQYTPEDFQKIVDLSHSTGNDIEDIHRMLQNQKQLKESMKLVNLDLPEIKKYEEGEKRDKAEIRDFREQNRLRAKFNKRK